MSNLIAGVLSGIAGLLTFLVIHHFWILPIWFIAPAGLIIAALGGLAVGWSYAEIQAGLPRSSGAAGEILSGGRHWEARPTDGPVPG